MLEFTKEGETLCTPDEWQLRTAASARRFRFAKAGKLRSDRKMPYGRRWRVLDLPHRPRPHHAFTIPSFSHSALALQLEICTMASPLSIPCGRQGMLFPRTALPSSALAHPSENQKKRIHAAQVRQRHVKAARALLPAAAAAAAEEALPANDCAPAQDLPLLLDGVRVVLVSPKTPANIGAVLRVAENFEVSAGHICVHCSCRRRCEGGRAACNQAPRLTPALPLSLREHGWQSAVFPAPVPAALSPAARTINSNSGPAGDPLPTLRPGPQPPSPLPGPRRRGCGPTLRPSGRRSCQDVCAVPAGRAAAGRAHARRCPGRLHWWVLAAAVGWWLLGEA